MWLSQTQVRWLIVLLALLPLIPTVLLVHNMTQGALRDRGSAVAEITGIYRSQLSLILDRFSETHGEAAGAGLVEYLERIFGTTVDLAVVDDSGKTAFGDPDLLTRDAIVYQVSRGGIEGWTVYLDGLPEFPDHIEEQYRQAWMHASLILVGVVAVAGGVWFTVHRRLRIDVIRGDLLDTISHEIKTPLAAVQVLAETLRHSEPDSAMQEEYLDLIQKENGRIGALADRFLTVCRLDRGQIQVKPARCDLPELLREQVALSATRFAEAGGSIRWKCPDPLAVTTDRNAIEVVLGNLIENALKYGGEPPRVSVEARESGRWVEIAVIDEGPGIARTERKAVFRRFYRSDAQLNGPRSGAGLGLSICRRFMKLLKGGIRVDQNPSGRGACFVVSLPNRINRAGDC